MGSSYENKACGLNISEESLDAYDGSESNLADIYTCTLIEYYFANNGCFLEEGQLLREAFKTYRI